MNWYIGQPIVAIRSHSLGQFKKGQEFKIVGLESSPCSCTGNILINIGVKYPTSYCECIYCGALSTNPYPYVWYCEYSFAPLDQDISELTEVLNQKQPFEL